MPRRQSEIDVELLYRDQGRELWALLYVLGAWILRGHSHDERADHQRAAFEQPALEETVVATGFGYQVTQRGTGTTATSRDPSGPLEDPLHFSWKRSSLYEPHSGERVELDMLEVVVAVNDLTISLNPFRNATSEGGQ